MAVSTIRRVGGYFAKEAAHCGEYVAKENMPNTYDPSLKEPVSAFLQRLFDSGNEHERVVFARVLELGGDSVALLTESVDDEGKRTKEGRDQLERDTFEAFLNPKVSVILGGRFGVVFEKALSEQRTGKPVEYDTGRISQPDIVLVKREGSEVTLLPVDVKDHKVLSGKTKAKAREVSELSDLASLASEDLCGSFKSDDTMQLAHYFRHFQSMGLAGEAKGAIVGREMRAVWCNLDESGSRGAASALDAYDTWLARGRDIVANAVARDNGKNIPALTSPELSTYCGECAWSTVCEEELVAHPGGGHITLLPGITPLRAKSHYAAGVDSIRALARLDYEQALALELGGEVSDKNVEAYRGSGVKDLAGSILQARATTAGRVARLDGVDRVEMGRADVEFDFDLENSEGPVKENSGEHHGSQLVYLWGTRQVSRRVKKDGSEVVTVKVKQFSDFSDTAAGEAEAFASFWAYMMASRESALAKGKTWRAFHYTSHEISWMRKLAERYAGVEGVPSLSEVEEFTSSTDVVDLYKALTAQLIWPTRSHSIKHLAKWARFSWRASDAGGDNSMLWFEKACTASSAKERSEYKRKVLEYNVDDVAAQCHLRDWISSLEAAESPKDRIPAATALRKPRV